jgi:hypothetical protein
MPVIEIFEGTPAKKFVLPGPNQESQIKYYKDNFMKRIEKVIEKKPISDLNILIRLLKGAEKIANTLSEQEVTFSISVYKNIFKLIFDRDIKEYIINIVKELSEEGWNYNSNKNTFEFELYKIEKSDTIKKIKNLSKVSTEVKKVSTKAKKATKEII